MNKKMVKEELQRAALLLTMTTMSTSAAGSPTASATQSQSSQVIHQDQNNTPETTSDNQSNVCDWQKATAYHQKVSAVIADAEKNGYLPQIELSHMDKSDIKNRQTTLEERLAQKTEKRNKEYLKDRAIWGERYAEHESFTFGNWTSKGCENFNLRAICADTSLPLEDQLENKKKLAQITGSHTRCCVSQIREPLNWKLKSEDISYETQKEVDDYNQALINQQFVARAGKKVELPPSVKETATNYQSPLTFIADGKIFVNKELLPAMQDCSYKMVDEAARGNSAALNCLIYHELNHKHNWEHDGLGQLSYTPINAAKGDVLTEKLSLTTEYLHMVKEYSERKAKGETTIKYDDGTEKPLDHLLEICPGLKEAVEKHGTDVNNPTTKRAIVQAAMNFWENERGRAYLAQTDRMLITGNNTFNQISFSQQMDVLKNEEETYKKVSEAMLSDINIGDQQIDLKDCKDLIDTFTTQDAKNLIAKHNAQEKNQEPGKIVFVPTYQEYQEINQYLESIGKKTDAEKMEYISKTVQTASSSIEPFDKKLEDIMLKYNPKITSDYLDIERTEDKVVASVFGKKYDLTEYATPARTNTNQKMSEATKQQLLNQSQQQP